MAVTSVWSIKKDLKNSINYITNPEKTLNGDYGNCVYQHHDLDPTREYNFKNEKFEYVSGINCKKMRILLIKK